LLIIELRFKAKISKFAFLETVLYMRKKSNKTIFLPPLDTKVSADFIYNKQFQMIALLLITFGLYCNTISAGYVLDDLIVITQNSFTHKGFAGIKDILFKDSFVGFTGMENQLAGGRYRPLSIITFAIEQGVFGGNAQISHFINVMMYCGLVAFLYAFLNRFVFKDSPLKAFIAALLFAIHPIHTEVVANIKSRDELMSLLFLLGAMWLTLSHSLEKRSLPKLLVGLFLFFLSLLSKENGLVYFVVVPMLLYYFHKKSIKDAAFSGLPYFVVIVIYFVFRIKLTGFKMLSNGEILNAPFLYATAAQSFATKVFVMGKYLVMMIWPYPMSYDYSYNQIKYVNLSDVKFLLSFLANVGLLIYAIGKIKGRHILSFCILFYFACMALVTNFVFEVGTAEADRFLFQPSLAFVIAAGFYVVEYVNSNKQKIAVRLNTVKIGLATVLVIYGFITVARNADWKTEDTLFLKDVETSTNSAKTHSNCGVSLINLSEKAEGQKKTEMLNQAVAHLQKSVAIHPTYVDAWLNLGVAYSRLNDLTNTEATWLKAKEISPAHPKLPDSFNVLSVLYFNEGFNYNKQQQFAKAVISYQKAIQYNYKDSAEAWYNVGGNLLMSGHLPEARQAWMKTLQIKPNHTEAKKWLEKIANAK
jgi:tetratricopeptide (TPR) repeat protein